MLAAAEISQDGGEEAGADQDQQQDHGGSCQQEGLELPAGGLCTGKILTGKIFAGEPFSREDPAKGGRQQADQDARAEKDCQGKEEKSSKSLTSGGRASCGAGGSERGSHRRAAWARHGREQPVQMKKEKSQDRIEDAFRMNAGSPEQGRGQEQDAAAAQPIISEPAGEDPEKGDGAAEGEKGEKQGIDIQVIEGEKVKEDVHPFDHIMGQVGGGGVVCPEGPEIRE